MDIKERLGLTSRLNTLLSELSDKALPIKERIAMSNERLEVFEQLKVDASQPKIVDESKKVTLEQFKNMSRIERMEVVEDVLRYDNWYEYQLILIPRFHLVSKDKAGKWVVFAEYFSGGSSYSFAYKGHIAREEKFWKNDAGKASANGGFGSWKRSDRTFALKKIETARKLVDSQDIDLEGIEYMKNYQEGVYKEVSSDVFKMLMQKVSKAGLALPEVGSGMVEWFEWHPARFAA